MKQHNAVANLERILTIITENTIAILDRVCAPGWEKLDDLLHEREKLIVEFRTAASRCKALREEERNLLAGLFKLINNAMEKTIEAVRAKLYQLQQQRRQNVVTRRLIRNYKDIGSASSQVHIAKA